MSDYIINVSGEGLKLSRSVSREVAERIVVEVLSGQAKERKEEEKEVGRDPEEWMGMDNVDVWEKQMNEETGFGDKIGEVGVEKEVEGGKVEEVGGSGKVPKLYDFVKQFEVERTVDKILLIGVYMAKYQDVSLFEKKDIVAGMEAIAEPIPKNLSRDIGWAVKIGWIAKKVGVRGVYYVTDDGYEVVESGFEEELVEKTALGKVKRR